MTMAAPEPAPKWRNALNWAPVGLAVCAAAMLGGTALLRDGGVGALLASHEGVGPRVVISLAVSLLFGGAVIGFSQRNAPFNPRTLRNFVVLNAVFLGVLALGVWSYHALAGAVTSGAVDGSANTALILGLVLLGLAILCSLVVAAAHARAGFITDEQAADTRERSRATIYSAIWMAAMGLTLVLLCLARPAGAVSPAIALAGSVVLLGIATAAGLATRPLLDELWLTLSRESGSWAFHLLFVVGGSWTIVAHLGFVGAPSPLDWLTLLTLSVFAASLIAIARRGLLKAR
jgi:hypothetical protein